jgi:hypothetical protein
MSTECISVDFDECDPDDTARTALVAVRHEGERYHVHTVSKRLRRNAWSHVITRWALGEDDVGTERARDELPDEIESAAYEALEGRLR